MKMTMTNNMYMLSVNKNYQSINHKPLLHILGEKCGIPQLAANRLQRWAVMLQGFDYSVEYVRGENHSNADGLSRLPLADVEVSTEEVSYLHLGANEFLPVTPREIRRDSERDPVLGKVINYVRCGWPPEVEDALRPFFTRKNELALEQGCVMWGTRVVVPPSLRQKILNELHTSHFGICKMKALARSYVWWPKLDTDLEQLVRECNACFSSRPMPGKSILLPWTWPRRPWQRIHIDIAGPFMGKYFLVLVDSHSSGQRWVSYKALVLMQFLPSCGIGSPLMDFQNT